MEEKLYFTTQERRQLFTLYKQLFKLSFDTIRKDECRKLKGYLQQFLQEKNLPRNAFGMNPIIKDMQTAIVVAEEIGMKRVSILSIMLHEPVKHNLCSLDFVKEEFGEEVAGIIKGLVKINELYTKSPTVESENFRNLLLSFAEDMRVILIMIADRVNLMRQIKDSSNDEARQQVSNEAAYLYAPLAHKLGLYKLKSELEDLSLKHTEKEIYYHIKEKLNETKASRDRYIAAFIQPIQKKLEDAGLKFHMKGRTKSIHSIYQKMKKQKCPFEGVYDLFAIRIIIDSEYEKEKQECKEKLKKCATLLNKLDNKKYLIFLIITFSLISFSYTIGIIESIGDSLTIVLTGLFLYSLGGYISKYNPFKNVRTYVFILAIIISLGIMAISYRNSVISNINSSLGVGCYHQIVNLYSENSLICLVISTCIFELFNRIKMKPNKVINYIAGASLITYIMHDNDFVYRILLKTDWIKPYFEDFPHFVLLIISTILSLPIISSISLHTFCGVITSESDSLSNLLIAIVALSISDSESSFDKLFIF